MGDASGIQATETVRISGSDAGGKETYTIDASANHEFTVVDRLNHGGLSDEITVLHTAPTEVKVGASPKAERKNVIVQGLTGKWKWGYTNDKIVFEMFKKQYGIWELGPDTSIWIQAVDASIQVAIGEAS